MTTSDLDPDALATRLRTYASQQTIVRGGVDPCVEEAANAIERLQTALAECRIQLIGIFGTAKLEALIEPWHRAMLQAAINDARTALTAREPGVTGKGEGE